MKRPRTLPQRFGALLGAAAIAAVACGVSSTAPSSNQSSDTTPIKIGVVTGLTGPYAQLGEAQKNGAELAIKVLGGKAGSHPISTVVRDDQIKPALALQQTTDLVQTEQVNFLTGCVSAATTLSINQVAKQAGIPYLGTCQTQSLSKKENFSPDTFHIAPLPSQDVTAVIPWVLKNLGKNVALMLPDYAWGHEQGDAYAQVIPADGTFRDLTFDVKLDRSSWVAVRIYPSSHTNPVFVLVGGKPIRASKRSAEWCLKGVDQCWSQKERAIRPAEQEAAKAAYDVAREAYRKVLAESEVE